MTPASEIAARWCYAELRSTRFGCTYKQQSLISTDLWDKAHQRLPFKELIADEIQSLEKTLQQHPDRGPAFYPLLMSFPHYAREKWDYGQLCQVVVVPYFGCRSFPDFELDPHVTVKEKLDKITDEFSQDEPIIVVYFQGRLMLLEGTLRSLWFARDRQPSTRLEVWVPVKSALTK